jgi:hypothetical protein
MLRYCQAMQARRGRRVPAQGDVMAEAKTKPTKVSVRSYLDGIANEPRRRDCETVAAMMKTVTKCEPRMWGPSIVGFDTYHYKYESGREGDMCVVGFSSRKTDLVVYLVSGFEGAEDLLQNLGSHKLGKSCLYIRRLSDVNLPVLERLVARSVEETKRRYP